MKIAKLFVSILILNGAVACSSNDSSVKSSSANEKFAISCQKSQTNNIREGSLSIYTNLNKEFIDDSSYSEDSCSVKVNSLTEGLRITRVFYAGVTMQPQSIPQLKLQLNGKNYSIDLPKENQVDFSSIVDNPDFIIGCSGNSNSTNLKFSINGAVNLDELVLATEVVKCK